MSKILKLTIDALVYESANPSNDPADADKLKISICEQTLSGMTRPRLTIPTATTDQAVPLSATTSAYVIVAIDQVATLKVNGDAGKTYRPTAPGKKTPVLFMRGDITSLTVSNASGSDLNIDVISAN